MPAHGPGDSDMASHEENEERQPLRPSDSHSDDAPVLDLHTDEDDSPAITGNNHFSAAIAAIQQVTHEVHQLLGSIASPVLSVEVLAEPDNQEAGGVGGEQEEPEGDNSGRGINLMDADDNDDQDNTLDTEPFEDESDPFEDDSDPFEDDTDPFEDERDPFRGFRLISGFAPAAQEDYMDEDLLQFHSGSGSSDFDRNMDASSDTEGDCTSDEVNDLLLLDPSEREVLGSLPEPKVALHTAVVKGDVKSLARWQALGTGIWARKVKGDTSLHLAARSGDVATVDQLLQDGAPLGVKNKKRHTPLEVAALCGHAGVVKVLLRYGAGADSEEMEHALLAAKSTAVIQVLVEDDKDIVSGVTGAEILSKAARDGRVTMVQALLKAGADANWPGTFNRTALHAAASRGHIRCVSALLEGGADLSALDDQRWTALHCAAFNSHGEVVQRLVQAGADLNAKSGNGQTPFDVAFDEVVRNILVKKA